MPKNIAVSFDGSGEIQDFEYYTANEEVEIRKDLALAVEGLSQENTDLQKVLLALYDGLQALKDVPLRDLEDSIDVLLNLSVR